MAKGFKKDIQYYKFCLYGFLKNQKFYEPFFLLFLLSKDISYFQIGVLYSIKEITRNILEIPAGVIADSAGRRKSMVMSFLLYIISFIVFFLSEGYALLIIAMVVFGMADVFRTGTHKAMIFQYLDEKGWSDQKVYYYGRTRSCSQTGSAISSLIAAAIVLISDNYSMIFAAAIIPYALNLLNMISYPSRLDGDQKKMDIRLFRKNFRNTVLALRKAFGSLITIRIFVNSSLPSGYFNSVKDYFQPLVLSLVATLPILETYQEKDKTSVLIGALYFIVYLLTSRASRVSGKISELSGPVFRGMNITYIFLLISGIGAGLLYHFSIEIIAVIFFILLYVIENLRRPIAVSGIADHMGNESLSTFLSTESQMKSIFTIILSPLLGLIADRFSPGAGLFVVAALVLLIFPFIRLKAKIHLR